jgi:phytoene dehydrogenase-like protein
MGRQRTSGRVVVGFVPWILCGAFAGAGWAQAGVLAGLVASLGLLVWRRRRRTAYSLEIAALAFFAAAAGLAMSGMADEVQRLIFVLPSAVLALVAWATLAARAPFTAQYAREDWPPEYWQAPLFRRVNVLLTATWASIFTVNAALAGLALAWPGARLWLVGVLPQAGVAAAVLASILLPGWYSRRWAAREIAARDPYPWPVPAFGRAGHGHDVIVVGAGIGGLTAAALLADRGLRVLVLEQHYLAGGFCTSWPRLVRRGEERLRYVFDAGVHDVSGLGPRGPVRRQLERLEIDGRLDWRRVSHEYDVAGVRVRVPPRAHDYVAALAERFPGEAPQLRAFFDEMEAVYRELYADIEATGGVPRPPTTVDAQLAYPAARPHAFRWMTTTFHAMLDRYFVDARLKAVLAALSGYLSDRAEGISVTAMAPIFGYYFDGGYYPAGGSQALADALVGAIEERGGEVRLRTPVSRILVEDGRAAGVVLRTGAVHRAAAVVSNADVRRTFLELVGHEHLPGDFVTRIEGLAPSTSAFAVFLGLDVVPDLAPLTLSDRGIGIAIPSIVDPSLAPAGHAAVTLLDLVPAAAARDWDRADPGYHARKRRAGDALIERAEWLIPSLRRHIIYRQDGSPATFARYAWTTGGSIYGPAMDQSRPPAKSPLPGLALAGAGVFPGAGVEAVVISGTLAADALVAAPETAVRERAIVAA